MENGVSVKTMKTNIESFFEEHMISKGVFTQIALEIGK